MKSFRRAPRNCLVQEPASVPPGPRFAAVVPVIQWHHVAGSRAPEPDWDGPTR